MQKDNVPNYSFKLFNAISDSLINHNYVQLFDIMITTEKLNTHYNVWELGWIFYKIFWWLFLTGSEELITRQRNQRIKMIKFLTFLFRFYVWQIWVPKSKKKNSYPAFISTHSPYGINKYRGTIITAIAFIKLNTIQNKISFYTTFLLYSVFDNVCIADRYFKKLYIPTTPKNQPIQLWRYPEEHFNEPSFLYFALL